MGFHSSSRLTWPPLHVPRETGWLRRQSRRRTLSIPFKAQHVSPSARLSISTSVHLKRSQGARKVGNLKTALPRQRRRHVIASLHFAVGSSQHHVRPGTEFCSEATAELSPGLYLNSLLGVVYKP